MKRPKCGIDPVTMHHGKALDEAEDEVKRLKCLVETIELEKIAEQSIGERWKRVAWKAISNWCNNAPGHREAFVRGYADDDIDAVEKALRMKE